MKVFLTGGTGVVGRALVPLLVGAGHEVRAHVRSSPAAVVAAGAEPVTLAAYDTASLTPVMAGCDVAIDLTTHVPSLVRATRRSAWAEHDRLRDAGTAAVVAAATASGVRRVVRDSVAFIHADGGSAWIDETWPAAPGVTLASAAAAEAHVAGFAGEGVILRFGLLYGPEASQEVVHMIRRWRVTPILGPAGAYATALHTTDAAAAVLAAVTVPPGTYEVVDDVPLTRVETVAAQAAAFGVRRVRPLPSFLGKGTAAESQVRSLRVSNARFRLATGWAPAYPSAREGWAQVATALT